MRCPRAEFSAEEPSRGQGEARVLSTLEVQTASSGDPASGRWPDATVAEPLDLFESRNTRLLHLVLACCTAALLNGMRAFSLASVLSGLPATEVSYMSLVIPLVCSGITYYRFS